MLTLQDQHLALISTILWLPLVTISSESVGLDQSPSFSAFHYPIWPDTLKPLCHMEQEEDLTIDLFKLPPTIHLPTHLILRLSWGDTEYARASTLRLAENAR